MFVVPAHVFSLLKDIVAALSPTSDGAFVTVATIQQAALAGMAAESSAFNIPVPIGYKYKFTQGGLAGTTETIDIFSKMGV